MNRPVFMDMDKESQCVRLHQRCWYMLSHSLDTNASIDMATIKTL